MSRRLDDLSSQFRPVACELLARLTERGIPVLIVDTLRTLEEHRANLASGASSAILSFHLARSMRVPAGVWADPGDAERSDAMDIVPFDEFRRAGPDKLAWDASLPEWAVIGELAERLGLEWGGRWKKPHDPGHVQWPRSRWA